MFQLVDGCWCGCLDVTVCVYRGTARGFSVCMKMK